MCMSTPHDQHDQHAQHDHSGLATADHGQSAAGDPHAGHDAHDAHDAHAGHAGHDPHAGHHGHGGHGDHAAQFRDKFWVSLVVAVPVVAFSSMFAGLLGYDVPSFPGSEWISPVLGTFLFAWGGWPFLSGGVAEARAKQPGMMLLIAMAITVAFVASWATTLGIGGLDLDFWWELALLVVIMLLGHWIEMRALGAASGALDALAALLPDTADRVDGEGGATSEVALGDLVSGDVVLVRSGARVPADGVVVDGSAEMDESMVTGDRPGRSPAARATGSSPGPSPPTAPSGSASPRSATTRRSPASVGSSPRPRRRRRGRRRSPTAPPRCSSGSPRGRESSRSSSGSSSATSTRRSRAR
jgi:Cu2+-exporting ATPase